MLHHIECNICRKKTVHDNGHCIPCKNRPPPIIKKDNEHRPTEETDETSEQQFE
jgi:hypothetical protein